MKSSDTVNWLNKNGNLTKVVRQFFANQTRIAVFMAGIPGAGKTELARRLVSRRLMGFVVIEHDEIVKLLPNYKPELAYEYRPAGNKLMEATLKQVMERESSFIVDTTLSSQAGRSNVSKSLRSGYLTVIVYVHQTAKASWTLTQKRETVTKRGINPDGFAETCQKINGNLIKILDKHRDNPRFNFIYVDKTSKTGFKTTSHTGFEPKSINQAKLLLSRDYDLSFMGATKHQGV